MYGVNKAPPNVLADGTYTYVYGVGLAYAVDSSGNLQVDHADGLGSVRAISDNAGNVIQTYQTDPFGVPTQTQGTSTQPFQFTGQQRDAGSSLYYLRARYYDPATGRFLTRDTVVGDPTSPRSLNRYTYAQNNPTTYTDPSGRCLPACLVVGLYVVGVGVSAIQTAQAFADPNSSLKERLLSVGLLAMSLEPEGGVVEGAGDVAVAGEGIRATSIIQKASDAAFQAAERVDEFTVPTKHLPGVSGRWAKFAANVDPRETVAEALRSPNAMFLPNENPNAFQVVTNLGRAIGTKGQAIVKVIVGWDGKIWTAFPVR